MLLSDPIFISVLEIGTAGDSKEMPVTVVVTLFGQKTKCDLCPRSFFFKSSQCGLVMSFNESFVV